MGEGTVTKQGQCLPGLYADLDPLSETPYTCRRWCTKVLPNVEGFCSPGCPCGQGEGPCADHEDCAYGLSCEAGRCSFDPERADADRDGIVDALDNCPYNSIPDQADDDGDGVGNLCDNCVDVANPQQEDFDRSNYFRSSNVGDACEQGDIAVVDNLRGIRGGRLDDMCPGIPGSVGYAVGDVVRVTYRTYLNSQQDRCPTPETYSRDAVPTQWLDMQMRWCSCLNTLGRDPNHDNDEFLTAYEDCERWYCPNSSPYDPTIGRDFEDRVGWFEPLWEAYNVYSPTVRYPYNDLTDRDFITSFPIEPTPGLRNPDEDHDHDEIEEGATYQYALPRREYVPHCETDPEDAEPERRSHEKEILRWTWVDEYMSVPGGNDWGAQVRSLEGHCFMLWLQSGRSTDQDDNQYSSRVFCPRIRCAYHTLAGWIVTPELVTPSGAREQRLAIEIERGIGYDLSPYFHPDPVGPNAGIEGLVVQSYTPAEESHGEPYRSVFTDGSRQIEGRGLRFVTVQVPFGPLVYGDGSSDEPPIPVPIPVLDGELEEVLLAYGGAYTDGTFEDGVWLGRVHEVQSVVEWDEAIAPYPGDEWEVRVEPPGRAYGVLLASPIMPYGAVLFGGETSEGLASDLWTYSAFTMLWTPVVATGDVPSPRAEVGFAQTADLRRAYLYGGRAGTSSSAELFALDLETMSFEQLWPPDGATSPGPAPRRGAAVALDEGLGQVLVFGGVGDAGPLNDLWSFDLEARSWNQLSQPCEAGLCPPLVRNAVMVFDETHRVRVVLGRSDVPYDDPMWSFTPGEGWTSESTSARDQARDCDDDGVPDPNHGVLCQPTDAWWTPLGVLRCGTAGLSCSAVEAAGEVIGRIRAPGARELAALGPALLVMRQRRIEAYDTSEPSTPVLASSVRLRARARDLDVGAGLYAYVAAGRAVEVLDLSDPLEPEVVGRLTLRRKPKGLALVAESTLVATTREGLAVIDVSDPESPEVVSFLWLQRGRAGWDAQAGDWRRPPRRWRCGGRGPRPVAASGQLVIAGAQGDLLVVDVSDPNEPSLLGTLALDEPAWRLRAVGLRVYVAGTDREVMSGPVVDISDPSTPVVLGEHEVAEWVRGALWSGDRAYRPRADGVEIVRGVR
jgi:hypothetical protein